MLRPLQAGEKTVWDERRRRLLDKETGNHLDRRNLWQDPGAFIGAAVLLRHQVETDLPFVAGAKIMGGEDEIRRAQFVDEREGISGRYPIGEYTCRWKLPLGAAL